MKTLMVSQRYRCIYMLIKVIFLMVKLHNCDGVMVNITQIGHRLDVPGQILTATGQKQCVRECMRRGDCLSVNYWRSDLRCQLNPSTVGPGVVLVPDSLCDYMEKNDQPQELIPAACSSASCSLRCTVLSSGAPTCVSDPITPTAVECPSDFTWNPSVSLCYKVIETPMLWQGCKTHCEALGARLAILDTPAKLDALLNDYNSGSLFSVQYFIGASYNNITLDWRWVDGLAIDPWFLTSYPVTGSSGVCLVWNDVDLLNHYSCILTQPFICEKAGVTQGPITTTSAIPTTTTMISTTMITTTSTISTTIFPLTTTTPTTTLTTPTLSTTVLTTTPISTTIPTTTIPTTTITTSPTTTITTSPTTTITTSPTTTITTSPTTTSPTTTITTTSPTTTITTTIPTTTITTSPTTTITTTSPTTTITISPTITTSTMPTTTAVPTTTLGPTTSPCPSPYIWKPAVSMCYKNYEDTEKWLDAKTMCTGYGARLAILDTAAKLSSVLDDYNAALLNNTDYHIGAQYVYGSGWQWVDGTAVDPTFLSNYGITNVSGDCLVWTYTSLVIQDKCDASGKFLCDISV